MNEKQSKNAQISTRSQPAKNPLQNEINTLILSVMFVETRRAVIILQTAFQGSEFFLRIRHTLDIAKQNTSLPNLIY